MSNIGCRGIKITLTSCYAKTTKDETNKYNLLFEDVQMSNQNNVSDLSPAQAKNRTGSGIYPLHQLKI